MSLLPENQLQRLPANEDDEHLRLLALFHYILGGLMAAFALMPLLYLFFGLMLATIPQTDGNIQPGNASPAVLGGLLAAFGAILFAIGEGIAVSVILTGRFMAKRRHYTFTFIISCIQCLAIPFGTILGVFSLIVLSRPSVQAQFAAASGMQS